MDGELTFESLMKLVKQVNKHIPTFEIPELDDFMDEGKKIGEYMMVTGDERFKDIPVINTKHGFLDVSYNMHMPRVGANRYILTKKFNYVPKF